VQTHEIYSELSHGRSARYDEKLIQLLTGAASLFADLGYDKASIRQVASAVGMSMPGLYYYVKSKEELLFLIQYQTFGVLTEKLEGILAEASAPERQLERMVASHVRYLVDHMPELKVCTTELDSLQGEFYQRVRMRRQRYFELTRVALGQLRDQDGGSRVDPNMAALYLFGLLNWIVMWFNPDRNDPEELSRSLAEFFLAGFRGKT
jgi:AcrR family transcriptional regulator